MPAGYNVLLASFKYTFEQKERRIHWTDFHQIFTVWQVFDRSLPILPHFSNDSRDVATTTNFRAKIGKIGLFTLFRSYSIPNWIAI